MKKIIAIVILVLLAVGFMPNITMFLADKALEKENLQKSWAPSTVYRAGKINMRFMRYNSACGILQKAIKAFPNEDWVDEATYQIALCYEKVDLFDKAIQWYQKFTAAYPDHIWVNQANKRVTNIKANL